MPEQIVSSIPRPEAQAFRNKGVGGSGLVNSLQGHAAIPLIDRIEYPEEGGILIYHVGSLHPVKGFPFPEAVIACNSAKRFFITHLKLFTGNWLAAISMLRIKNFEHWLEAFNFLGSSMIEPYLLEEKRYTPLCQELHKFIRTFLMGIGVGEGTAIVFSEYFSTLIEYDDAYRYILEDIFGITSREDLLENPVRELKLMFTVWRQREGRPKMHRYFGMIFKILYWVLKVPRIKRAFRAALEAVEFERMQMDEADRYHTLRVDTYNFGGRDYESRRNEYIDMHTKAGILPQFYIMKNVQSSE